MVNKKKIGRNIFLKWRKNFLKKRPRFSWKKVKKTKCGRGTTNFGHFFFYFVLTFHTDTASEDFVKMKLSFLSNYFFFFFWGSSSSEDDKESLSTGCGKMLCPHSEKDGYNLAAWIKRKKKMIHRCFIWNWGNKQISWQLMGHIFGLHT